MVKKSNIGTVTRRKMNIVICDDDMDFATVNCQIKCNRIEK